MILMNVISLIMDSEEHFNFISCINIKNKIVKVNYEFFVRKPSFKERKTFILGFYISLFKNLLIVTENKF